MMPTACVEAIEIVSMIHEANNEAVDNNSITRAVEDWYTHSDIVDPEMLAAAVLEYGMWRLISFLDWECAYNKWFPQYDDTYAIWDFEASYHDEIWR